MLDVQQQFVSFVSRICTCQNQNSVWNRVSITPHQYEVIIFCRNDSVCKTHLFIMVYTTSNVLAGPRNDWEDGWAVEIPVIQCRIPAHSLFVICWVSGSCFRRVALMLPLVLKQLIQLSEIFSLHQMRIPYYCPQTKIEAKYRSITCQRIGLIAKILIAGDAWCIHAFCLQYFFCQANPSRQTATEAFESKYFGEDPESHTNFFLTYFCISSLSRSSKPTSGFTGTVS